MEQYVIFHVDGGIGKNIAATSVCKSISEEYPDIVFLKVDVEQGDLAEAFDVSALPTFLFLKNGNIITRIQGANVDALKNELNKLN